MGRFMYDFIMSHAHYEMTFRIPSIKFILNVSLRKLVHDFSEKI